MRRDYICTLGEFIDALMAIDAPPDTPVYVLDADTDWLMEPGVVIGPDEYSDEIPPPNVVCITADYHGRPDGAVATKEAP